MSSSSLVTLVVGYRDRESERIRRFLESLDRQTCRRFELTFVDYGSRFDPAETVRRMVESRPFARYLYTDTRGQPWSRSRALNVGVRRCTTPFVLTSDVDMVFPPRFLEAAIEMAAPERRIHAYTTPLPQGFDDWGRVEEAYARFDTVPALGGCQCVATEVLRGLGGFDEHYCYWGIEDRDLDERLRREGLEERLLPEELSLAHQWHPVVNDKTPGLMPAGVRGRMEAHFWRMRGTGRRNEPGWGRLVEPGERAVDRWIDLDRARLRADRRPGSGDLHRFAGSPDDKRQLGLLVQTLCELPPGDALAVAGAGLPRRNGLADLVLKLVNAIATRFSGSALLDYRPNLLHDFLAELLVEGSIGVDDYYLGLTEPRGVSLLVKERDGREERR